MIRRSSIVLGIALVAATSLTSCSTFDRADTAAIIGGEHLTRAELDAIDGNVNGGDSIRRTITTWLQLGVMGGDTAGITTASELDTRMKAAIVAISTPFQPQAEANYALGLDGAPLLCLRAIPVVAPNTPDTVLSALSGGMSFADAAKKFSSDPTLAASGGIVGDGNGTECLDPVNQLSPELVTALKGAKLAIGAPGAIKFRGSDIVIELRPFADLGPQQQAAFAQTLITAELKKRLDAAKVYVNPRYGHWDPASATVLALDGN